MADTTPSPRWAVRHVPPEPRAITTLLRSGVIDAELAATVWLLLEGRVPLVVAAEDDLATDAAILLGAALDLVPAGIRRVELAGADETFAWLPQATELGWDRPTVGPAPVPSDPPSVRPDTTMLVVPAFSDALPSFTWGEAARIAVRAATIGYGLAGRIEAGSLEAVYAAFRRAPIGLSDDELSRLGVVLVMGRGGGAVVDPPARVVAAHYVRPVARDEHGHVQRLGPAVLATWDPTTDRFEHFGWGITPELARRVGRRAGDFEVEVDRRRAVLTELVTAGVDDPERVRAAIAAAASADTSTAAPAALPH